MQQESSQEIIDKPREARRRGVSPERGILLVLALAGVFVYAFDRHASAIDDRIRIAAILILLIFAMFTEGVRGS